VLEVGDFLRRETSTPNHNPNQGLYTAGIYKVKRPRSHNSEDDFVLDDGADDSHQRDDEQQAADNNEHDGSDAQQLRVGRVRPDLGDTDDVWVHQHPDANAEQRQPAQLTQTHTPVM